MDRKKYWTNLDSGEEAAGTASEETSDARAVLIGLDPVDRRAFLKLAGMSLAAGALAGCQRPVRKIIPYLNQPPEWTPGEATWYATTCHGCSAGCGALAKVMDGRPIKLEGNPDHAMSRGGLCAVGQASLIGLYDPNRQRVPAMGGAEVTWKQADAEIMRNLAAARGGKGKVVLLTETITGPSTRALINEFLKGFPNAEHVIYDAVSYDAIREAHRLAYGRPMIPGYRFDKAAIIVSFGADFLGTWLSPVEFAKQYSAGRDLNQPNPAMARHYQLESGMSLTGSNADIRYTLAPSEQAACISALSAALSQGGRLTGEARRAFATATPSGQPGIGAERIEEIARAILRAPGQALIVSDSDDVFVQSLVLSLNETLGNTGATVDLNRPSRQKLGGDAAMERLLADMSGGKVAVLLVHGCNPAYTHPRAGEFINALQKVACTIATTWTPDETARLAKWHCPAHHPMESWGDAEPQSGRYSLFQPTIRPLYKTRAFEDSLLQWSGRRGEFHTYLKQHWQTNLYPRQKRFASFQDFWDGMLQRGFLELAPSNPAAAPLKAGAAAMAASALPRPAGELELELYESVALRDGASANNPWLQELPDPLTKITWNNFASISPSLARERHIKEGQWLEIVLAGKPNASLRIPAHIQPGQHPRTISIALGYGRTAAGPVAEGVGVDAYPAVAMVAGKRIRTVMVADIKPVAERGQAIHPFARTQIHATMDGRPVVQEYTYAETREGIHKEDDHAEEAAYNLWEPHHYPEHQWGMAIDLSRCIGCSACVTGCDIENNVPVVGPREVSRQREMHWMRLDRYYEGDPDDPRVLHQPMLCQHCDNASCETVCPVLATVHDDQGLNVQVYNRCVGTRYCANNCPYKVRRFNWFSNIKNDPLRHLALNPDVTVRSRGVMEKCSFCIHRIQSARIKATNEGRKIKDGEIRTACEQSCPTDAIVFGDLKDPKSRVSQLAASQRGYRVLEELNRQPAVHYLAKVRNTEETT